MTLLNIAWETAKSPFVSNVGDLIISPKASDSLLISVDVLGSF